MLQADLLCRKNDSAISVPLRSVKFTIHTSDLLLSEIPAIPSRRMAIIRKEPVETEPGLPLLINNGDLDALKSAVDRLGFKDEQSLLRFVLAVMSRSSTRTVTVIDLDGKSVALNPSEALLAQPSTAKEPA